MPLAAWADVVPLPENRAAMRAARRVGRALAKPGRVIVRFAPVVLHGPPGTGKTLIAASLVATASSGESVRTARTVAANDLDADDEFADLGGVDLLVLEDLQHLPQRAAAGVVRLLDARGGMRLPTVVTASAGPAELKTLPARLTSRLAAGLVLRVGPPTPAGRAKILAAYARRRGVSFTPDAAAKLAATPGGVRPMLGQVEALKTLAGRRRGPIDLAAVDTLREADEPASPGDRIVLRVAAAFGVKPKDLTGASRLRTVLVPRQVAMYLAREAAKLPLARVGELLGGRDHSTVLHAVRKVRAAIDTDPELAAAVAELWAELA